jgi:hypothetical protein
MLIRPPNGDQAASPVSSYNTIRTFGAPLGASFNVYGVQSGFESRTSSLIVPLNFFAMRPPRRALAAAVVECTSHANAVVRGCAINRRGRRDDIRRKPTMAGLAPETPDVPLGRDLRPVTRDLASRRE